MQNDAPASTNLRPRGPGPIQHAGESLTLKEWSRRLGVPYRTLWARLRAGRTPAEAFDASYRRRPKPVRPGPEPPPDARPVVRLVPVIGDVD